MFSYTQNHLLALTIRQVFIKHPVLCWQVPLTGGGWGGKEGLRRMLLPGTFYGMRFLFCFFTVLVTVSTRLNMPAFHASVYFIMSSPRCWTVPSGKAKASALHSQLDIKDEHK